MHCYKHVTPNGVGRSESLLREPHFCQRRRREMRQPRATPWVRVHYRLPALQGRHQTGGAMMPHLRRSEIFVVVVARALPFAFTCLPFGESAPHARGKAIGYFKKNLSRCKRSSRSPAPLWGNVARTNLCGIAAHTKTNLLAFELITRPPSLEKRRGRVDDSCKSFLPFSF